MKRQVAKSGRAYYEVPDDFTVDEWDDLTTYERMVIKGLIVKVAKPGADDSQKTEGGEG